VSDQEARDNECRAIVLAEKAAIKADQEQHDNEEGFISEYEQRERSKARAEWESAKREQCYMKDSGECDGCGQGWCPLG
jgi:hypothetical protein